MASHWEGRKRNGWGPTFWELLQAERHSDTPEGRAAFELRLPSLCILMWSSGEKAVRGPNRTPRWGWSPLRWAHPSDKGDLTHCFSLMKWDLETQGRQKEKVFHFRPPSLREIHFFSTEQTDRKHNQSFDHYALTGFIIKSMKNYY